VTTLESVTVGGRVQALSGLARVTVIQSQKEFLKEKRDYGWECSSVVKHIPSMFKALSSNPKNPEEEGRGGQRG
jgi:hypothetical protein